MDRISMLYIMFLCAGVLIIAYIYMRNYKKDVVDISDKNLHFLQQATRYPIHQDVAKGIKKTRWIWTIFALWIVYFGSSWIAKIVVNMQDKLGADASMQAYVDLWRRQNSIQYGILFVGILLIIAWIIYDVRQTKKPENKYKVPAYVQSTFTNPKHRTRSAQLIYYDYKQLKCRLKTVSIHRLERKMGTWNRGDMIYIIVEEGRNRVRFLTVLEERVSEH